MADSFSARDMNSLLTGRSPSATARADGGGLLGVLGAQSVATDDTADDTGFASLLAGSALPADSAKTDRITELLTNRAPSLDEVGAAASRAAFGLEGFGEALTKMRASKLAEQKTLFSVLSAQQAQQQRAATLDIQRQRLDLDTLKMLAERGDKNAKAVQDAIKFSVPDPSQHNAALLAVQDSEIPVDATNAYSMVPQIVADKGIPTTAAKKESAAGFQPVETGEGVFAFDRSTGQMGQRLGDPKPTRESSTQRERMINELLVLEEKAAAGPLSPQETRRHQALSRSLTQYRNIEGQGLVAVPLVGDGPTVAAPPTLGQKDVNKLELDLVEERSSVRALDRYMEANKGPQGAEFVANKALGQLKTIFGGELDANELNALRRSGQMNAILGRIRQEVLGPGTLTETDAQRLVDVLGGNPGWTTNREVVQDALNVVMSEKKLRLRTLENQMARAQGTRLGEGFPPVRAAPVAPAQAPAPAPERTRIRYDAQGNPLP